MPCRWIVCPFVEITPGVRVPHVSLLRDPGSPAVASGGPDDPGRAAGQASYSYAGIELTLGGVTRWVGFVNGFNLSAVTGAQECITIFEQDFEQLDATAALELRPRNTGEANRIKARLNQVGVDTTGLDANTPIKVWLQRVGVVNPEGIRTFRK